MKPLRFCMITTFYPPYAFGGDAIFVYRLTNMLAQSGHEVDVIHCIDSYRALAKGPLLLGYDNKPGVTLHGLVSGLGILSPLATYQTGYPLFKGQKLQQILAAKPFDVIHFHNISLIGGPMILRYGEGIKLYTMHEHWLICPTHILFKFNREPCVNPRCFRCTLLHHRPPQLWRYTGMLKIALRYVDAFISPSRYTLHRHHSDGLDIPIVYIPPFLSSTTENPTPPPGLDEIALPSCPFFLFVGRLERAKGLDTVIPLFQTYYKAHLVIAGEGSYAGKLKKLAAGCDRIHFLGQLTQSQLQALYARAIALLVPSTSFETFGQVIIEAFAAHTPVIVRDLGPLPEIVAESGGGLIFKDNAGLLAAMEQLLNDRPLRNRLGKAGYRIYRSQFTEQVYMERYLGLVEEIQARKRLADRRA